VLLEINAARKLMSD